MAHKNWNTVDRLYYLASGGEPTSRQEGICYDILKTCYDADTKTLTKILLSHPLSSGNEDYPIAYPTHDMNAEDAYQQVPDLWVGEYGDRRREFAHYAAKQLEQERKSTWLWGRFTFWE